jgi:LuxR family maltose regulon positive regulatory protein
MSGQKKEALRGLQRWLYYEEAPHPGRQTKLMGSLIFIRLLSGELPDAAVVVQQARDVAAQHDNSYILAWTSYLQGYIHYFWHDLEKAAQSFALAAEKLYVMYVGAAVDSLAGLALTYQALGQPDHANATIVRLLDFTQETHDPAYMTVARSCQARLAVLRGDTRSAARWLRTADLTADAAGTLFYWLEVPRLTQCRVLIAQGTSVSLQDAIEKLQSYRLLSEATHNTCQMIQILALEALARQKQGQTDDALHLLEKAAILAEPGGWIHPFVELGPEAASLLSQLGRQGTTPHFIAQILAAFPVQPLGQPAASHPRLPEPLTDREIEVLALLAQRHSNKEIAADLVISTATVKRHASNIYQKLQVRSRRQAVAKAIALGILPPSN